MIHTSYQKGAMSDFNQTIKTIADAFHKDALAYFLHFESSEQRLTQALKTKPKEKYGKQIFMPKINWFEAHGEDADSDAFDEAITAYLDQLAYNKEKFVLPKNRLINMIWNNVREEGKKIIQELSEKQP